jgi:tRNA 2-thiouridine synthesizing protein A
MAGSSALMTRLPSLQHVNRQGPWHSMTDKQAPDVELDITTEVCPMTFVRTRLALDRMAPGQTLLVRLRGDEPLRNVPRTAREQGHEVLSLDAGADGVASLLLRRGG